MENNLYFIVNSGCDASTYGLARISDEDFPRFKAFIEDLNKNSYYGCMPRISVYIIDPIDLKEIVYDPSLPRYAQEVRREDVFYLGDKTYTFAKEYFPYYSELELVAGGE